MEDVQQEILTSGREPKQKMSGWLIALIVFAALAVLCCLCFFLSLLLLTPVTGEVFSTIIETVEAMTPVP